MNETPISPHIGIAEWLSQLNPTYIALLKQCQFSIDNTGAFVVECPSTEVLDAVAELSEKIAPPIVKLAAPLINLSHQGEVIYSFSPKDAMGYSLMVNSSKILQLPENLLVSQIVSAQHPVTLIRMRDHKALLCNEKVESISSCKPNDWTGEDVSRFWIDDGLKRFTDALEEHGSITEYAYRALLFTGEPRDYCVNARLVSFRGDICRLVENLI